MFECVTFMETENKLTLNWRLRKSGKLRVRGGFDWVRVDFQFIGYLNGDN